MKNEKQARFYLVFPTVLFFSFLIIFFLTAILSLLSLFFGIGKLSDVQKNILFTTLILQVVACIITLFKSTFRKQVTATKSGEIFIHPFRTSLLNDIAPLENIEQRFLQVLVYNFQLKQMNEGVHLDVTFASDAPAIWTDAGKGEITSELIKCSFAEIEKVQKELDSILIARDLNEYQYNGQCGPFRYASGGALPIITIGQTNYYCLIYREIPPVGWNIANGGCDSRDELLNPLNTIVRELNEELIIIDKKQTTQYFYQRFFDLPDHIMVREHLQKHLLGRSEKKLKSEDGLISFKDGPDTLTVKIPVKMSNGDTYDVAYEVDSCFININAIDGGIELDKIAHIKASNEAIFIDGEIAHYYPRLDIVNAPVGLFKKETFDQFLSDQSHEFIPDIFFWSAIRYPHSTEIDPQGFITSKINKSQRKRVLLDIVDRFVDSKRVYKSSSLDEFDSLRKRDKIFDLCPVTRNLVLRSLRT